MACTAGLLVRVVELTEPLYQYGLVDAIAVHVMQEGLNRLIPVTSDVAVAIDDSHRVPFDRLLEVRRCSQFVGSNPAEVLPKLVMALSHAKATC